MLVKDRAIDEVNRMCEAQALARIPNPVRWYPNVDDADIIQHVVSVHLLHRAFTTPTALPIEDQNHNKFGMGFQGIGYFPNIMSNGNTYSDMIISEVMSSENLPGLRCIYGVREVANVYALYFYYHDVATHAAGLAAGNFSPFHMLDPFSTKKEVKKEVKKEAKNEAENEGLDEAQCAQSAQSYLKSHFPHLITQYVAINNLEGTLQLAYRVFAGVHAIGELATNIGMAWPENGSLPKETKVFPNVCCD
ncbi:hypothetical protein C8R44DRAFT_733843 [Mycena epipterygia]|nr:hypothetical protein C8R44DRAFT_733843 [Mycena epipterygia]